MLLQEQNRWESALEQFTNAYKLDETEAEYAFECAFCNEKVKDYELSKFYYLKAIELNPKKPKYYMYFCDFLCECMNEFVLSKTYFKELIDLDPDNPEHYYQYARCLRDYGENEYIESEKYYLKCLEIDNKNQGTNGSYAYLLYLMKRYDESKKYLEIEFKIDDNNGWSHFYYGLLHQQMGEKDVAIESLERAVKLCRRKQHMIPHLETIKKADPENIDYHNKFAQLIEEKFENSNDCD